MNLTVSVVIPAYNAATRIASVIESLKRQSRPCLEILVVDDGSGDDTADQATGAGARVLKYETNRGAAFARLHGAENARGDIVAFVDADCSVPEDWTKKLTSHFESDVDLVGVGGRYLHSAPNGLVSTLAAIEEEYIHDLFALHPNEASPPGGNCAFRRSALASAHLSHLVLFFKGIASGEDSVVCDELRKVGPIRFDGDLAVLHAPAGARSYFRRNINRGFSRTTIVAHRLTRTTKDLSLEAYGGVRLFVGSLLLPWALALLFVPNLRTIGVSLLAIHLFLSHRFLSYARKKGIPFISRCAIRWLVCARSLCWMMGIAKSLYRDTHHRLVTYWNTVASIFHFWMPGRISKMFYFVTSRCNARCSFCFNLDNVVNWKERRPNELTLEEVDRITRRMGRLPFLTMSGGEPFMREDLPRVVEAFYKNCKTQWVTIPTNAALTRWTVDRVVEIMLRCPRLFLTIQVSLDSLFEDHDESRKIKGGFRKMIDTLGELAALRARCTNLRIQLATCYGDMNEHRMNEIVEYCQTHLKYDQQMFYLIRDARTPITKSNNRFLDRYRALLSSTEAHEWKNRRPSLWHRAVRVLQTLTYQDLVAIKQEEAFIRPCHATQKFVTLYDDGQLSPCEVLETTHLGNIRDYQYDFYRLKRQTELKKYYKARIVKDRCQCDWMCALPLNMLYDVKIVPRIFKTWLKPLAGSLGDVSVAPPVASHS